LSTFTIGNSLEDTQLQAERQYRTVVETATDAVITTDAASMIQFANPAVTKIFGYEPSELMGQPLTVLMPDRLANRHLPGLQHYVETGHRRLNWSAIELIGRRKDGQEFPIAVSFAEVVNDGQQTFTGFIRDVTERKQAEELRAARSRLVAVRGDVSSALTTENTLRGILQSSAEAVVVADAWRRRCCVERMRHCRVVSGHTAALTNLTRERKGAAMSAARRRHAVRRDRRGT
jgi:PAS domain S-box-containing protein